MKVLVDDFAVLAVESCLMKKLEHILTPDVVMTLSDETVRDIAAESEESQAERRRLTEKLNSLEEGLKVLQVFARHRLAGLSSRCLNKYHANWIQQLVLTMRLSHGKK